MYRPIGITSRYMCSILLFPCSQHPLCVVPLIHITIHIHLHCPVIHRKSQAEAQPVVVNVLYWKYRKSWKQNKGKHSSTKSACALWRMDVPESNIWFFKAKEETNMKVLKQAKVWPCKYAYYWKQVWTDSQDHQKASCLLSLSHILNIQKQKKYTVWT